MKICKNKIKVQTHSHSKFRFVHKTITNKGKDIEHQLKVLLNCYPESAYTYENGLLALHLACIHHAQELNIVRAIVLANPTAIFERVKICPKMKNYIDSYPIHIALSHQAPKEVIRLLIGQNNELLRIRDTNGSSPLQVALKFGANSSTIHFLLAMDQRSNQNLDSLVKLVDYKLNFPLHTACRYGCEYETMETLIIQAVELLYAQNRDGETPIDYAYRFERCSDNVLNLIFRASEKF